MVLDGKSSQKYSVNAGVPQWSILGPKIIATKIIGQGKALHRQRIPESSCVRKETVDIGILVTSRNGDKKIMQSIRLTSRPTSRKRKWNQLSHFRRKSTKVMPIEKT